MVSVYSPFGPPVSALSRSLTLLAALVLLVATLPVALSLPRPAVERGAGIAPFAVLPLAFVPNVGQTDAAVLMETRSAAGTVSFLADEVAFTFPNVSEPVRIVFDGVNTTPTIVSADPLPGRVNDLRGTDPAQWHTDIPTYAGLVYQDLYPGIDLWYDGAGGTLKGTYTVAPGADPARIRWGYSGVTGVAVDTASGDLRVTVTDDRMLTEAAPVAWQAIAGQQVPVTVRYAMAADGAISFALGAYNAAYPLVIDPIIAWSTYVGGSGEDQVWAVATDAAGNVYLAGDTWSTDFPLHQPLQPTLTGTACPGGVPCGDAFITKLSADGHTLLYSTYLGGSREDLGLAIAVDGLGQAYVSGQTRSTDFPLHQPLQARCTLDAQGACADGFVVKLNARGSALVYSTYLGGSQSDTPNDLAVDSLGQAVVVGNTRSTDFPLRTALQPKNPGAPNVPGGFVTKLTTSGTALVFSTYLGGSDSDGADGVALDHAGNVYVAGSTTSPDFPIKDAMQPTFNGLGDAYVTKLSGDGRTLVYSTYLGGQLDDLATDVAVDRAGSAYVVGFTDSADFPVQHAVQPTLRGGGDTFVTKLTPNGRALVYSTYLGGSSRGDVAWGIALDVARNVYLAGTTVSADFPVVDAVQPTPAGGECVGGDGPVLCEDAFVTKLRADGGALVYSTYVGGRAPGQVGGYAWEEGALGIGVDGAGNVYVAGITTTIHFPTHNARQAHCGVDANGLCRDGFVVKIGSTTVQLFVPVVRK